jgi:hypothetical protein
MTDRTKREDEIIRDGGVVRVPLYLADSGSGANAGIVQRAVLADGVMHRPGSLVTSDADKVRREQLITAWRSPATDDQQAATHDNSTLNDRDAAFEAKQARTRDAWQAGGA